MHNYIHAFLFQVVQVDPDGHVLAVLQQSMVGDQEGVDNAIAGFGPLPPDNQFRIRECWLELNKANAMALAGQIIGIEASGMLQFEESPRDSWNTNDPSFSNLGKESASGYVSKPQPKATKGAGRGTSPMAQLFTVIGNLAQQFPAKAARLFGLLQDIQSGIVNSYAQALAALSFIMKGV